MRTLILLTAFACSTNEDLTVTDSGTTDEITDVAPEADLDAAGRTRRNGPPGNFGVIKIPPGWMSTYFGMTCPVITGGTCGGGLCDGLGCGTDTAAFNQKADCSREVYCVDQRTGSATCVPPERRIGGEYPIPPTRRTSPEQPC